jgi:hypothetical protein
MVRQNIRDFAKEGKKYKYGFGRTYAKAKYSSRVISERITNFK